MKVLVIDNYDSFTFNLVQLLGKFKCKILVKRNNEISLDEIIKTKPDKILISPGPKNLKIPKSHYKLLMILVPLFQFSEFV